MWRRGDQVRGSNKERHLMDELTARLQAVEDRLGILELEGAYAELFDGRRGEEWANLFTEDGSYQSRTPHADVHGREALARMCTDTVFDGIHLLNVPRITIEGDRATGRVHFTFHAIEGSDVSVSRNIGYYDVEYVRTSEGWRIRRRITRSFARDRATAMGYAPGTALDDAE
jgi:hypothetical protein